MGTWGVEPFENDDGCDIQEIWDEYIGDRVIEWGSEKTFSFFRDVYFKGSLPVVSDGNSALIIALAQKFDDNNLELSNELKQALNDALNLELESEILSEWGRSKPKRNFFLVSLQKKHNLKISLSKNNTKTTGYTAEIESLKTWFENLETINGARESMSLKTMDFIDSIKPEFGKYLDNYSWDFYDEQDEDGSAELGNLRYMYIIWFVLFNIGTDSSDIIKAIESEKI
jgi:hypothetical protein